MRDYKSTRLSKSFADSGHQAKSARFSFALGKAASTHGMDKKSGRTRLICNKHARDVQQVSDDAFGNEQQKTAFEREMKRWDAMIKCNLPMHSTPKVASDDLLAATVANES